MSKKKKNKKAEYKSFIGMLKDKQKKIFIMKGDEKVSLTDAVDQTVKNITSVPIDSVIGVSSEDAVKNRDSYNTIFTARYAKAPFTLYEYAMKYPKRPQTFVLTVTPNEVEDIFDYESNKNISVLMERTNIGLILKKAEKAKNRLKNWLKTEPENDIDMFVLNIPDIVLFTDVLKKDEVSKSVLFNITIQVIKTKPSINKIKKKNEEKYKEVVEKVIDLTLKSSVLLGNSFIHIPVEGLFMGDLSEYGKTWISHVVDTDNEKAINEIVFSADNSVDFTELSGSIIKGMDAVQQSREKRTR